MPIYRQTTRILCTLYSIDRLTGVHITEVACGNHHVIAVSLDNKAFSWGTCKYGALGLGRQVLSAFPTHVQSSLFEKKIVKIACAQDCTILLLENGDVLASGRNNDNKLGFGEKINRSMFFVRLKFCIVPQRTFKFFFT